MKYFVTGGSGGIGSAVTKKLIEMGHEVTITYFQNETSAKELAKLSAKTIQLNQATEEGIGEAIQELETNRYDGLVNNAGELHERQLFLSMNPDEFLSYVNRGLNTTTKLSYAFAKKVTEDGPTTASIVNVLSSYTLSMPPAQLSAYITLKYALLGLTKALATELIQYGVRVNAVSPSMTKTGFLSALPDRFIEIAESSLPMKRLAHPTEVSDAIVFLLGTEATYINGVNLPITGGQVC